jgi:predicted aldo/keto reductase-like oxidoreductase
MTTRDAINEFVSASGFRSLHAEDLPLLQRYARINSASYCRHACNACEDSCPAHVDIPDVMRTRMYAIDYRDMPMARAEYAMIKHNAGACLSCSAKPCAGACPYGLRIAELTDTTHQLLA